MIRLYVMNKTGWNQHDYEGYKNGEMTKKRLSTKHNKIWWNVVKKLAKKM
jgi:hypothetical protein